MSNNSLGTLGIDDFKSYAEKSFDLLAYKGIKQGPVIQKGIYSFVDMYKVEDEL